MRSLPLLEVLFDSFRFAKQVRNVLVVRVNEALQVPQVLLKLFGEFQILLVTPCAAQCMKLTRKRRRAVGQILIELLEHLREEPQFAGIDNGLSHDGGSWFEWKWEATPTSVW
jgi:hypothetical protein